MHLGRLTHADIALPFILDHELGISKHNMITSGLQSSAVGKQLDIDSLAYKLSILNPGFFGEI